jgi:hypothetical protein
VLFAVHVAAAFDPGRAQVAGRIGAEVVRLARMRTNAVSCALIEDYAAGEASQPVVELAACLLTGDMVGARAAAGQLLRVGHSTGQETLTGLLAGLVAASHDATAGDGVLAGQERGMRGHQGED